MFTRTKGEFTTITHERTPCSRRTHRYSTPERKGLRQMLRGS
jgi:hypothetical protein